MGWRLTTQPDGRYAIFSTVVDDLVHTDLTEEGFRDVVLQESLARARRQAVDSANHMLEHPDDWDEIQERIREVHG